MRLRTFALLAAFLTVFLSSVFSTYGQAVVGPLAPGTYYVDISNGTDDYPGYGTSPGSGAWQTLHYAIERINDGNSGTYILNVAAGTYSKEKGESNSSLIISNGNNTVTIQGAAGAIIDGTDGGESWDTGFEISASNVTIRDLEVRNFGCYGISISSGTGNIIQGCEVHDNGSRGINIQNSSPDIKQNKIYDNPSGIFVTDSGGTASPQIQNNLIYDTDGSMDYGVHLHSEEAMSVSPNIFHNTIDGGNYDGIYIEEGYGGNAYPDIKFNVITSFNGYGINNSAGNPTIDYNDLWNNTGGTCNSCSQGTYGISQDPVYVDLGGADYHLQSYSPCIDAIPTGDPPDDQVSVDMEGITRHQRSGYDMGAYEYENVAPVISFVSVTQRIDGSGYLDVEFTGTDAEADEVTWYTDYCSYTPGPLYDTYNPLVFFTTDPAHTADEPMTFSSSGSTFTAVVNASSWTSGNYKVRLKVEDPYDHSNYPLSSLFQVDNSPPNAPNVNGTTPSSDDTPTWTWTSGGGGNGTFRYQLDSEAGTWIEMTGVSYTPESEFSHGESHTLYVQERDDAGNWSGSGSFTIAIDTIAPTVPVITTNDGNDYTTSGSSVTLEGTCPADTVVIYVNGSADGVIYTPGETTWTYTGTLQSGANTFNITAEDAAGNVSSVDSITVTFALAPGIYYVDIENGTDDLEHGASSETEAWETLHYAINLINQGLAGDYTLHVGSGTYQVTGETEPDEALTITQNNVRIIGETGSTPVLDGTGAESWSKGMEITGSNITIEQLYITGFDDENEVGIKLYGGSGNSVQDSKIYGNRDGVVIFQSADCTVNACEIYENSYDGISIEDSTGITITDNIIHDHKGISDSDGIIIEGCSPDIARNTLYDNTFQIAVTAYGSETASPTIQNNLIYETTGSSLVYSGIIIGANESSTVSPQIYHNTIDGGTYDGIVIENYTTGTISPEIKYNIITNFTGYGINNSAGSPTIAYNDVYGNATGQYGGDTADQTGTNGNISQDPLYASYKLQSTSPCIDTIPTDSDDPVEIDFPGYARPRDGGYDMGAYEFVSDITQDYSLPGGSGDVSDYRIFTVPVDLETGSALKAQMEEALGIYDKGIWRVFAWDPGSSSYIEMDDTAFATLSVYPGMALWIISTSTDTISFSGQPAPDGSYLKVALSPGWNMFALPWPATSIELDNIAVSDAVNNYWITSESNSLTQKSVWDYTGTGPDSGYEQLTSGSTLQPAKGYWIKVEADSAVTLLVPKDNTGGYFEASSRGAGRSSTGTDSDEEPPPLPPGGGASDGLGSCEDAAGDSSTSSEGATVSAKGGCFIATAAYGSRLHPYVKPLRGFRDSYLLSNAPGRKLIALYYRYSPAVARFIAKHAALKHLTRLLLLPVIGLSAFMLYTNPIFVFVVFMGFVGFIGFVWLKR